MSTVNFLATPISESLQTHMNTRAHTQTHTTHGCFSKYNVSVCLSGYPQNGQEGKKEDGNRMSELLIWLFCFVVDLIAWVGICGQFLHGLPVKLGMHFGLPIPICSIVHSTWLSLTCTASCHRDSHEPMLPLRKETFVTHRPVSRDQAVYRTNKKNPSWTEILICTLVCCEGVSAPGTNEKIHIKDFNFTSSILTIDYAVFFNYFLIVLPLLTYTWWHRQKESARAAAREMICRRMEE